MGVITDSRNGSTSVYYIPDNAPSYPELEARVKTLEKEVAECRSTIEDVCIGSCPECLPNWKQQK